MPTLPNAYALIVGIANYQHLNRLPATVLADAQAVRDALVDETLCAYPPENVTLLLDGAASQAGLRQALAGLAAKTDADATVFLYVSSHGGRLEAGPHAGEYLLPVDARADSAETLAQSALAGSELTQALAAIPARKLVVVFAQYLGLEQGAYRLLPVMAQPCTPRLGLRMLPILDLSDSDELAFNIERLVDQLRRPPERRPG